MIFLAKMCKNVPTFGVKMCKKKLLNKLNSFANLKYNLMKNSIKDKKVQEYLNLIDLTPINLDFLDLR